MKTVYPNQAVTFTAVAFGTGATPETAVLTNAILNVNGGADIPATISGQTMTATLPAGTAIGNGSLRWRWHQVAGGEATDQDITLPVLVAVQPSLGLAAGPVATNVVTGFAFLYGGGGIYVQMSLTDQTNGAVVDPTAMGVLLALTRGAKPGEADWQAGDWLTTNEDDDDPVYWGHFTVEDGDFTPGAYFGWVKVAGLTAQGGYLAVG